MRSLHDVPAEIGTSAEAVLVGRAVHLLVAVLPDVTDPQVSVRPIEREAPRVPHAVRPDLRAIRAAASEGIVVGYQVRSGASSAGHVDPKDLAEERVQALAVAHGVAAGTAVAHPDVEEPVSPEGQTAAVVVREGLLDVEQHAPAPGIGQVAVLPAHPEFADVRVAVDVGVVDIEGPEPGAAGSGVAWRERKPEEAALAARADAGVNVEEWGLDQLPVLDDPDRSCLLEDEQPSAAVGGATHENRRGEAPDHLAKANTRLTQIAGRGGWGRSGADRRGRRRRRGSCGRRSRSSRTGHSRSRRSRLGSRLDAADQENGEHHRRTRDQRCEQSNAGGHWAWMLPWPEFIGDRR